MQSLNYGCIAEEPDTHQVSTYVKDSSFRNPKKCAIGALSLSQLLGAAPS